MAVVEGLKPVGMVGDEGHGEALFAQGVHVGEHVRPDDEARKHGLLKGGVVVGDARDLAHALPEGGCRGKPVGVAGCVADIRGGAHEGLRVEAVFRGDGPQARNEPLFGEYAAEIVEYCPRGAGWMLCHGVWSPEVSGTGERDRAPVPVWLVVCGRFRAEARGRDSVRPSSAARRGHVTGSLSSTATGRKPCLLPQGDAGRPASRSACWQRWQAGTGGVPA